jgi:ABC-2 type transport system permease protein
MTGSKRPSYFSALRAILVKELRVFFLSPLAYVFLAAFLFLSGMFFYLGLLTTGEASLRPLMANMAIVMLFCIPMLTMRQFSEEYRTGSWELLQTAPVPISAIILGKWLASVMLCGLLLVLTGLFPIILSLYGEPDVGILFTSYLGLLACCSGFVAAGLFTSSLAKDQMVAGVGAILVLLPFWVVSAAESVLPAFIAPFLSRFSLLEHIRSFARGILSTTDILWFVGFTGVFLFLTWRSLESRRWR